MSNVLKNFKKKQKVKLTGETPQVALPDLYTLNKQLMEKEPLLTEEGIEDVKRQLYYDNVINPDFDFALLCRERYDFTVFRCKTSVTLCVDEIIDVLSSRGQIIDIELQEDRTYECWVKIDDEAFMYKLFKCDWIIDC